MSSVSQQLGLTDAQELQVVYQYFTLEQWKLINNGLNTLLITNSPNDIPTKNIMDILIKLPSASFDKNRFG